MSWSLADGPHPSGTGGLPAAEDMRLQRSAWFWDLPALGRLQLAFPRLLIQGVKLGFQSAHTHVLSLSLLTSIRRRAAGLGRVWRPWMCLGLTLP